MGGIHSAQLPFPFHLLPFAFYLSLPLWLNGHIHCYHPCLMTSSFSRSIVAVLCFVTFALSALVSRTVFERLPHLEDEVAYLYQARVFANGDWVIPSPENRRAFWQPFIVDNNGTGDYVRFSKYTPGWSLTLALGVAMGQAWIVNALLAAVAVALVYRLGSEIYSQETGVIAATLLTFSPAALLLNASLMAHTAALTEILVFIYAVWRMERSRVRWRWALVGGVALGIMLITRPAPTVGMALPFVAWVGVKALYMLFNREAWQTRLQNVVRLVLPFVLLGAVTLSFQVVTFAYNAAAVGDARANLYTLVWSYDRIGFGECCGRSGHTLEKAFRHLRFDMSLAAADLFGWQANGWNGQELPPKLRDFLLTEGSYWQPLGLSFLLLPLGVVLGLLHSERKRRTVLWRLALLAGWLIVAIAWCALPVTSLPPTAITNPTVAWGWLGAGMAWLLLPLLVVVRDRSPRVRYTWLFVAAIGCLVVLQMTYWVGSQRYSTRYWYEAIGLVCLLSALPIAALMRVRGLRWIVGMAFVVLVAWSYAFYSVPRVSVLYQFNNVSLANLALLDSVRVDERPILLLVYGDSTGDNRVSWRAYSTYIAVTSPYLDSEVVAARIADGNEALRDAVVAMFPERQVIEVNASGVEAVLRSKQ
jgi:hypothetical protein